MLEKILDRLFVALKRRKEDAMMRRFGGIQQCPWCRQVAQSENGWKFTVCEADPGYDVLTCGVCGGTSKWLWGMGMHFISALDPPMPLRCDTNSESADQNIEKVD